MRRQQRGYRWNFRRMKSVGIGLVILALQVGGRAQQADNVVVATLPSAPEPQMPQMSTQAAGATSSQAQTPAQGNPGTPTVLSVKDAQTLAHASLSPVAVLLTRELMWEE